MRSLYRAGDGTLHHDLNIAELGAALKDMGGLLWVDLNGDQATDERAILRDTFGFHPLAIEDALEESHVPKIDDWESNVYLVLHAVRFEQDPVARVIPLEVDVFVGENFLVTHHCDPVPALELVWANKQREGRLLTRGSTYLLYRLCDEVIAEYMPVVDAMDDGIDRLEDEVFDHPSPRMLEHIFGLKRSLLEMRRIIMPQREVMNKLGRGDFDQIGSDQRVYFRDLYDQLVRLHDIVDSMRDLVSGTLDTYLSVVNNRLNETMRTLTWITTLFMPLSFVASFFGMNFFAPQPLIFDAWTTRFAFVLTMAAMVMMPIVMFMWLRKRTPE
jgi:magnesium transporter